eukprot:gene19706-biopygen13969
MKSEGAAITTTKQLQEKMNSLRSYFGAEGRKTESSRRNGTGTDNVYISAWKFYSHLEFLQDGLTPRETVSNIETEVPAELPNESCTYEVNRPPSAKTARKMKQKSVEAAEKVMEGAAQMLRTIPDSEAKATLKVEFEQRLIQLRYRHGPQYAQMNQVMPQPARYFTSELQGEGSLPGSYQRATP